MKRSNIKSSKSSNIKSSKSSNIKSSKNVTLTKTLLQKALETGRGIYANKLVYLLATNIISNNTTVEVTLTLLLPKEIANIMITVLRSWSDYKVYSERVLLDKVILPITQNLQNVTFLLPKLKFSYIESSIILLGKLLITIAILKHTPKSYIIKLRKDLSI